MTSLPLDLSAALAALTHPNPIRVTETLGQRVNGRYRITELPERTITGVVLVIDTERLEFLSSGDATAGGINISTRDTLYFTDTKDGETEDRQSYIHYQGYKFRVVAPLFTMGNTVYNSYDCLRYMELRQKDAP